MTKETEITALFYDGKVQWRPFLGRLPFRFLDFDAERQERDYYERDDEREQKDLALASGLDLRDVEFQFPHR